MGFPGFFYFGKKKVRKNGNLLDLEKSKMRQHEYLAAKIGLDREENEPSKVSPKCGVQVAVSGFMFLLLFQPAAQLAARPAAQPAPNLVSQPGPSGHARRGEGNSR